MSCVRLVLFLFCVATDLHVGRARMENRQIRSYRQLCPPGCTSCSAINGCITCQPNLFLFLARSGMRQQGICTHSCPTGYYGVRRHNYSICYKCQIENCETCFGQSFCTRCTPPYLSYRGQCIDRCPEGMHYANYSKDCRPTVDCMAGPWALWSPCTRNGQNCGYRYGMITRTREVLESPSPNGARCPSLIETRCCLMEMRRCVDLTYNNSDLIPEKKKNRLQKHKKKRRKKKRRRHRKRNKKRRRRPKDRRKKRKKFRKRKKSRLNIRKKKLRIYKEAWKQFCRKDVVYIHVNSIL